MKRVKKKLFDDETDTFEEEDVENLCDDESEYSEEETLCAICVTQEKITKCGTIAEVAVNGLINNVPVLTARLNIFLFFVWIHKVTRITIRLRF